MSARAVPGEYGCPGSADPGLHRRRQHGERHRRRADRRRPRAAVAARGRAARGAARAPARRAWRARLAAADAALAEAALVVWAVKPQYFREAAAPCAPHVGARAAPERDGRHPQRRDRACARARERVVRAMPNTPALIGRGIAGLFARAAVTRDDRALVEQVLAPTGQTLWVEREADLDAVTALSGSGPAYVFYFVEAMVEAAQAMGLPRRPGPRTGARHLRRRDRAGRRDRTSRSACCASASRPRAARPTRRSPRSRPTMCRRPSSRRCRRRAGAPRNWATSSAPDARFSAAAPLRRRCRRRA